MDISFTKPIHYIDGSNYNKIFVIGDVHGELNKLINGLNQNGFNRETDLAIVCGDLVDRGPNSFEVLSLLNEPWFISTIGNHEQMAYDAIFTDEDSDVLYHISNGGEWILDLSPEEQQTVLSLIETMPLAIELSSNGKRYGMIHAEVPYNNWDSLKHLSGYPPADQQHCFAHATWARSKIKHNDDSIVKNIDHVFVGHSIVPTKTILGNTSYIDTGATYQKANELTIVRIQ